MKNESDRRAVDRATTANEFEEVFEKPLTNA
jgi:hypothetical protein